MVGVDGALPGRGSGARWVQAESGTPDPDGSIGAVTTGGGGGGGGGGIGIGAGSGSVGGTGFGGGRIWASAVGASAGSKP